MKVIAMVASLIICIQLNAQTIWLEGKTQHEKTNLWNHISLKESPASDSILINYNPSVKLDQPILLNLKNEYNQCQILTVYQPNTSVQEELIWQFKNDHSNQLLMTDQRMVDMDDAKFINFQHSPSVQPQLNNYHHFKTAFDANKFILGANPMRSDLPVEIFTGHIAEVIVFNHGLSPIAGQILESHLGLKYGIALNPLTNYLNIQGDVIWDRTKNESFNFRVSGIGRSTMCKFNQKQSQTDFDQGSFSIAVGQIAENNATNPALLNDESYLLWADNNAVVQFEKNAFDQQTLKRKWKYAQDHFSTNDSLVFQLNHPGMVHDLKPNERYWLAMDESQNGTFTPDNTEYYPLSKKENKFKSDHFNVSAKMGHFSIYKAPKFWAALGINETDCSLNIDLHTKIIGGKAPYSIELKNTITGQFTQANSQASFFEITELNQGPFEITIIDAEHNKWTHSFYLNGLDPSEDSFENTNNEWVESKNGSRLFHAWMGDCHFWSAENSEQDKDFLTYFKLSPNPSKNGLLKIDALLKQSSRYIIKVTSSSGQIVFNKSFEKGAYIHLTHQISAKGLFFISIETENNISTKKWIHIQ